MELNYDKSGTLILFNKNKCINNKNLNFIEFNKNIIDDNIKYFFK